MLLRISLLFLLLPLTLEAIKILFVSPKFGRSHTRFIGHIADTLVEAGFDVTVLLPEVSPHATTNGTKLAKRIIIPPRPEIFEQFQRDSFINETWHAQTQNPLGIIKMTKSMSNMFVKECEHILTFSEELDRLKKENFDLAIIEVFDGCSLGLIELLKIPAHVLVSPSTLLEFVATNLGVPIVPSYVPSVFAPFTDQMSYGQRAINLLYAVMMRWFFIADAIAKEDELFKHKFGNNFIDLTEKIAQASFILTNSDPFFDFPRPIIHKVVDLGGLSIPKLKPLDDYWKEVMERHRKVVLVSFGSVAQSSVMPPELKQTFLDAFDQFPDVTFIWKYENDEDHIAQGHDNVVTGKWLPQNDILVHPNLVAFITHGGMNSITETARCGKPVITIPLFGDQMRNARMAERAGFGLHLGLEAIQKKGALANAIATIINDKRYSIAASKLAKMIAKRPNPSKEQLIKHVQFAAEFGQLPNLDPHGRRMSFVSYYLLDIIIPFVVIIILICTAFLYLLCRLVRRVLFTGEKRKEE